jgi:hypothetical protein
MGYPIRCMTIEDHEMALALWQATEWISLGDTDARELMKLFLDHNPGLSLVVHDGDEMIGTTWQSMSATAARGSAPLSSNDA